MRLQTVKSKNAISFYIVKSFRNKKGKSTSKVVEKLGTLEEVTIKANGEDPYVWAKAYAAELTRLEKLEKRNIIIEYNPNSKMEFNEDKLFNLGYLFIQKIYHELELHQLMNSIAKKYKITFNINEIFLTLCNTRILYPGSKKSSFENRIKTLDSFDFDIHHVYRALDIIAENNDLIQEHIYKKSTSIIKRNTSVIYYDCTNFFFEIEEASGLKQYGKSKENRPNPIVQMGLFMDGDGIPLGFGLTPGNTNEQTTLQPLEKQIIKDYKLSKLIVVTDAGLSSKTNKKFNSIANRAYVSVQSIKKLKGHLKEWALDPEGWRVSGSNKVVNLNNIEYSNDIYTKERWINENGYEERLIISYSPKHARYQRDVRNKQIMRCNKSIENGTLKRKSKNPNDSSRFAKSIHTTSQGEVANDIKYILNTDVIDEEQKYDGFYGIVTNLEDEISEILKINQRRWEIEETFRIMKTEFKSRPVYLQKDERIVAHFLSCFSAMTIFRILEKRLNEEYTAENIIKTLREMNATSLRGEGLIPHFKRSNLTDSLEKIFKYNLSTEIIPTQRVNKYKRNSRTKTLLQS